LSSYNYFIHRPFSLQRFCEHRNKAGVEVLFTCSEFCFRNDCVYIFTLETAAL